MNAPQSFDRQRFTVSESHDSLNEFDVWFEDVLFIGRFSDIYFAEQAINRYIKFVLHRPLHAQIMGTQ